MTLEKVLWKGKSYKPTVELINLFLMYLMTLIMIGYIWFRESFKLMDVIITIFFSFVYYFLYRFLLKDKFKMRYTITLEYIIIEFLDESKLISKKNKSSILKNSIIKKIEIRKVQRVIINRSIYGFEFTFYDGTNELIKFDGIQNFLPLVNVLKSLLEFNITTKNGEVMFVRTN